MKILLIRHTTPNISSSICYGQSDIDVAETFSTDLFSILMKIADYDVDAFFSSPLIRCKKLAETLSNQKEIIFDDRLKELNFGDWELKPWNEIDEKRLKKWGEDFVNQQVPNGESFITMHNRTIEAFNEIVGQNNQTVIVVTHAGNIRSILAHLLELPLKNAFRIKVAYGAIVEINWTEDNVEIEFK